MHLNLYVSISLPPGPPPAPEICGVSFPTNVSSFTVEWRDNEMVDNFTFRITPSDLDCTRDSMTAATCTYDETDWGKTYTYVVSALNCGNQSGNEANGSIQLYGMYV